MHVRWDVREAYTSSLICKDDIPLFVISSINLRLNFENNLFSVFLQVSATFYMSLLILNIPYR